MLIVVAFAPSTVNAFGNALFQEQPTQQRLTFQSANDGIEIELPDFDELFHRVKQVSPLARVAMGEGNDQSADRWSQGFAAIDNSCRYHIVFSCL